MTERAVAETDDRPDGGVLVIMAANHWKDVRMADHQLAKAISAHERVLYVDPPVLPGRRVEYPRAEARGKLSILRPYRLPLVNRAVTAELSRHLVALQVRRALAAMRARAVTVLEASILFPVMGLIPGARSVYWAQDDWQGLAEVSGLDPRRIAVNESRLLAASGAVIAANPLIASRLEEAGHDVRLIPFGADTELFRSATRDPAPSGAASPAPAVLMGTINTRIDFDLIDALAAADVPVLLIGPVTDDGVVDRLETLRRRPSVSWIGEVAFSELPAHLAAASVGLVPYARTRFNEGSFPLKTLEYLSAGLPVVATDLPATRWLASPDIRIPQTQADFVSEVARAVRHGLPSEAERARRAGFAAAHDWSVRAEQFRSVVEAVRSGSRPEAAEVRARRRARGRTP